MDRVLAVLRGLVVAGLLAGGQTGYAAGRPVAQARADQRWPIPPTWWLRQAACIEAAESGGRVHDTRNATYRGLLAFGYPAWHSVGGLGDPASATRGEQVFRAFLVYTRDSNSWREWSTARSCGLT